MAKKPQTPTGEKIEREYTVSLRRYFVRVPRYKRVNRAIKGLKEFLAQHMKVRDRDLKKIKLDVYVNEFMWLRGIKKPPVKITVKAIKEGDVVRVTLAEMPDKFKYKKAREEKRELKATEMGQKKKSFMDKAKEATKAKPDTLEGGEVVAQSEEEEKKTEEKKAEEVDTLTPQERAREGTSEEEKQKKSAVVEAGEKMNKAAAKQAKHQAGGKTKAPKHLQRKALAK